MSHTVTTKAIEIRNVPCLEQAIADLRDKGFENLGRKVHKLYGSNREEGIGVKLPGFDYPAVIDPVAGTVKFDTYNGSRANGNEIEVDRLVQRYTYRVQEETAQQNGYTFEEGEVMQNGDVEVTMTQLVSC